MCWRKHKETGKFQDIAEKAKDGSVSDPESYERFHARSQRFSPQTRKEVFTKRDESTGKNNNKLEA